MFASILAPQQSDSKYVAGLIDQLNEHNFADECPRLLNELKQSETIVRKDVLSSIDKTIEFIENHNLEGAYSLLNVFASIKKNYFKPSDLSKLMEIILSSPELSESVIIPPLFGLCVRSITSYQDLITIVPDPRVLANFTNQSSSRPVLALLSITAELDESMRVPLVFGGLFESLLPTASIDASHSKLIGLLLNDRQNRRYFVDMGHVPKLCDIVFGSGVNDSLTDALLSLLSIDNLCILRRAQEIIMETGAIERFENIAHDSSSDEGTVLNCLKILKGCVSHNPKLASKIRIDFILDCCEIFPNVRIAALRLIECVCLASNTVQFNDDVILKRQSLLGDAFFTLFSAFIIFDHSGFSQIDFQNIECDEEETLVMQMVVYTQRHLLHPKALNQCRTAIDETLKAAASINILFSDNQNKAEIDGIRGMLVQTAYSFSRDRKSIQNFVLPLRYLEMCSRSFCRSSLGMWLCGEKRVPKFELQSDVFDISPSKSSDEHIRATKEVQIECDRRDRIHDETVTLSQIITHSNSELSDMLGRLSNTQKDILDSLLQQSI